MSILLPIKEVVQSDLPQRILAHGWPLYAVEPLALAEAEATLAEPVAAVPASLAERLWTVRIFAVPYLACGGSVEFVADEPPGGKTHSSLWLERTEGLALFIALRESDAHDAGFELLSVIADLLVPHLTDEEFDAYARLLDRESCEGATGEIDEETLEAKTEQLRDYPVMSVAATLAEYMHALWHDVHLRSGPEHLAAEFLRRRFELLQKLFPPNPGSRLFLPPPS